MLSFTLCWTNVDDISHFNLQHRQCFCPNCPGDPAPPPYALRSRDMLFRFGPPRLVSCVLILHCRSGTTNRLGGTRGYGVEVDDGYNGLNSAGDSKHNQHKKCTNRSQRHWDEIIHEQHPRTEPGVFIRLVPVMLCGFGAKGVWLPNLPNARGRERLPHYI